MIEEGRESIGKAVDIKKIKEIMSQNFSIISFNYFTGKSML